MAQHIPISHFNGNLYRKIEQGIINTQQFIDFGSLKWQFIYTDKDGNNWYEKLRSVNILKKDCTVPVTIQVQIKNHKIIETNGVKHIFIVA